LRCVCSLLRCTLRLFSLPVAFHTVRLLPFRTLCYVYSLRFIYVGCSLCVYVCFTRCPVGRLVCWLRCYVRDAFVCYVPGWLRLRLRSVAIWLRYVLTFISFTLDCCVVVAHVGLRLRGLFTFPVVHSLRLFALPHVFLVATRLCYGCSRLRLRFTVVVGSFGCGSLPTFAFCWFAFAFLRCLPLVVPVVTYTFRLHVCGLRTLRLFVYVYAVATFTAFTFAFYVSVCLNVPVGLTLLLRTLFVTLFTVTPFGLVCDIVAARFVRLRLWLLRCCYGWFGYVGLRFPFSHCVVVTLRYPLLVVAFDCSHTTVALVPTFPFLTHVWFYVRFVAFTVVGRLFICWLLVCCPLVVVDGAFTFTVVTLLLVYVLPRFVVTLLPTFHCGFGFAVALDPIYRALPCCWFTFCLRLPTPAFVGYGLRYRILRAGCRGWVVPVVPR